MESDKSKETEERELCDKLSRLQYTVYDRKRDMILYSRGDCKWALPPNASERYKNCKQKYELDVIKLDILKLQTQHIDCAKFFKHMK